MSDRFVLHPDALNDLEDIWEYLARDSPDAADHVIAEVFAAFELLASTPHLGHRGVDLVSRPMRFWTVHDYLVAYAPDEHPLTIIAVLHGRRSPRVLAALLRRRV